MKTLFSTMILTLAFSAQAHVYKCTQNEDFSPIDPEVGEFSMTINVLDQVSAPSRSRLDWVHNVKVVVKKKQNGKTTTVKNLATKAASEDVMFFIDDTKNGVKAMIYMDELDQSSVSLKGTNGRYTHINLNCAN